MDSYRSRLGFARGADLTMRVGEQQETLYKLSKSPCNPGKQRVSLPALVPTLPCSTSSVSRPLHSSLNRLAPVRLPSPPITHRLVMPRCTRLWAAFRRPSWVRNSLQRALPITVPPWEQRTLISDGGTDFSPQTRISELLICSTHHLQHAGDAFPRGFSDVVSPVHHTLISLKDFFKKPIL